MARLIIVEDNPELAALIDSAVSARGHTARRAGTGGAAMNAIDDERFDLALVDLLLPDMTGRDVLVQLRDRAIPAIAMSGVYKGDRYAVEATQSLGARAFFEKPFDMRVLLDAIDLAVGKAPPPAMPPEEDFDTLEELLPIDEDEEAVAALLAEASGAPSFGGTGKDEGPAEQHLPEEPASEKTPPGGSPVADDPSAFTEPTAPAALPLPFTERETVWKQTARRQAQDRALPEWSHAGDLRVTSVPRLLTAYYQAGHSGELKVRQGAVNKVVYFEDGHAVYAASNLASERFGRFCLRRGVLSQKQLGEVAAMVKARNLRTGDAMVSLELIDVPRRRALLEEQIREIIWSTFTWKTGQYAFTSKRPARGDLVKLRVFPGNLILTGVERAVPLVGLREKLPEKRRLFPSADPPYALHDLSLSGQQALLIAYADGSKTVGDLLALTELSERETLATLLAFEEMGLLVERAEEDNRRRISYGL